jgi:hypothetical protein
MRDSDRFGAAVKTSEIEVGLVMDHRSKSIQVAADRSVHPLLDAWNANAALLDPAAHATVEMLELERRRAESVDRIARPEFRAQDTALLSDGLHYETRIAENGVLATRENNLHDVFNALVWLRHPTLKHALNARQVADIRVVGPKQRTRGQCAMTHFDEAGAIVWFSDQRLLAPWDAHDWAGLFLREREAWGRRIAITVFGHALLERQFAGDEVLSTAKVIAVQVAAGEIAPRCVGDSSIIADWEQAEATIARAIRESRLLVDPQEMRPLPLAGIPGWHPGNEEEAFFHNAPCFRPLRAGRRYPAPLLL